MLCYFINPPERGVDLAVFLFQTQKKVELPKRSTYKHVPSKELYFGEKANLDNMNICDSPGLAIKLDDTSTWNPKDFYKDNDFKPSRHKLYLVYDEDKEVHYNMQACILFCDCYKFC